MQINVRTISDDHCILGESPIWHPLEKVLYWVDINSKKLFRLDVKTNQKKIWDMPTDICSIVPNAKGGLLVAMKTGIALLNPVSNDLHYRCQLSEKDAKNTRFNDGHCDRQGRYWVGSVDITKGMEEKSPIASIFRLDANQLILQDSDYICSNGVVTSLDSKYMYICETVKRIIYRYDFDATQGAIRNKKIFATLPDDAGFPDGIAIDSEGYLWNCHYNGWRITRYSPDGKIDRVIKIPTQSPTSCCFGGDDLKTLYITSAKRDVPEKETINQPMAGNLFAIDVDVTGIPEPMYLNI